MRLFLCWQRKNMMGGKVIIISLNTHKKKEGDGKASVSVLKEKNMPWLERTIEYEDSGDTTSLGPLSSPPSVEFPTLAGVY